MVNLARAYTTAAAVFYEAELKANNRRAQEGLVDATFGARGSNTFDYPNDGSTFMAADESCMHYCDTYFLVCGTQNEFFDEDSPRGVDGRRNLMMSENEPDIDRGRGYSKDLAQAKEDCLSACMQYPRPMDPRTYDEPKDPGSNLSGDTFWCRMRHLMDVRRIATNTIAAVNCPVAGPQGGGVCTEALVDGYTPHEQYRQGETTRRHLAYCDLLGDDTIADCTKTGLTDETLPEALSLLPDAVTMIILNNNLGITELGSDLFENLSCPKCIKSLFVQECRIESIDEEAFYRLTNLESLFLDANVIEELPENVFSNNEDLKEISVSFNRISGELPEDLFDSNENLERLQLSGNSPLYLPDGIFSGLSELTYLGMIGCQLTDLPSSISDLESLVYLDVAANLLREVEAEWFEGGWGSNLLRLSLDLNIIFRIDSFAFDTLESLEFCFLHDNYGLLTIPSGLFKLNEDLITYTLGSSFPTTN